MLRLRELHMKMEDDDGATHCHIDHISYMSYRLYIVEQQVV